MTNSNSKDATKSVIPSIWGSAVGMMAIAGIFVGGESVAKAIVMAVPPIAAAATTAVVLNHAKEEDKRQLHQAETLQVLESRVETLEAIVTREDYLLTGKSPSRD